MRRLFTALRALFSRKPKVPLLSEEELHLRMRRAAEEQRKQPQVAVWDMDYEPPALERLVVKKSLATLVKESLKKK